MGSRIHDRLHAERVTREAARACGIVIPINAVWDGLLGGFQLAPKTVYADNTFAPLNDPADAYKIESILRINVQYKKLGPNIVMTMSHEDSHGSLMATMEPGADHLRVRMETATVLAALVDTMHKVN